ncbi:response regulator [Tellurirhabdus bombi]|uniref:response regulator n=1 Tax=Tellurirhabdus bombi TaxID=2907205 RepID=UPI001F47E046|nr:response regulator [Tellurirhabdus bombi]
MKKILVVDDETDVQFLFEQRFRREIRNQEINFSYAHSGEEALSYLTKHESEFVIILSDINMPGMSGLELLKCIRTTHPLSPPTVMMITAYGDSENYDQAMQAGANAFLTKPLNFNELKEKLNNTV